jgi:hypothetical protein
MEEYPVNYKTADSTNFSLAYGTQGISEQVIPVPTGIHPT